MGVTDGSGPTRRSIMMAVAAGLPLWAARVGAQSPEPFKVIIAFPPGGTSTASMEPMLAPLAARLGAPVTLVYKPGAGGDVAAIETINSVPDGRTLFFGHAGPLAINPHITVLQAFEPRQAFTPLALVVEFPIVVCAHTKLGVSDVSSLIALGKTRHLVVGSSGNGSVQHLAGEAFKRVYRIETLHLPFAGGGPVQEALTRGALDVLCETGSNVVRHINEGRLVPLAVMSRQRLTTMPNVPTFAELGEPSLDVSAWFGLLAPAATPADMVDRLGDAILSALGEASVAKSLQAIGGLTHPLGRQAFAEMIASEHVRWGKFIHDAGLKPVGTDAGGRIGIPR